MTVLPPLASRLLVSRLLLSLFVLFSWDPLITSGASLNSSRIFLESLNKRRCPPLTETPMAFLDAENTKIFTKERLRRSSKVCQYIAQVDVATIPTEAQISWYLIDDDDNEHLIYSKIQRDFTIDLLSNREYSQNNEKLYGYAETVNRICLDPYMTKPNHVYRFKSKVKTVCDETVEVDSTPISVLSKSRVFDVNQQLSRKQAPLITMFTSSRMEYMGTVVQLSCHATGNPRPQIQWEFIREDDSSEPVENFDYIKVLDTNDVIINTRGMDPNTPTISLKCRARNSVGNDSQNSTLILINRDE